MSRIRAAKYDRVLTIQVNTPTTNDANEEVASWANSITGEPCMVKPFKGNETYEADQLRSVQLKEFWIRFRTGITEEHRIVFESENYRMLSIEEIRRRSELKIIAEVRDAE